MCRQCEIEAKGQRSGKGVAILSKYFLGMRDCKHDKDCDCEKCEQYRERNPYSDAGLF